MGKITDGEKLSRLTTKGTLRKKRGQPRIDIGIEFVVYAKLLQISKGRKITMWKAWAQLVKHRNFPDLMFPHFKKKKNYGIIYKMGWFRDNYSNVHIVNILNVFSRKYSKRET